MNENKGNMRALVKTKRKGAKVAKGKNNNID
jgi:hypothetical protein